MRRREGDTVTADWLESFLAQERLPESFRATLHLVCEPLAELAEQRRRARRGCTLIGLAGAQGSGKSTIAQATAKLLQSRGVDAIAVSLDDFYLPREARQALAQDWHPLFATRGPPGTHDVALACATLDRLQLPGRVTLPAFDKAADDRKPREDWPSALAPADVVFFEGWCVGAHPQEPGALAQPVNALEADEDPNGDWRNKVNDQLAGPYRSLFGRLDALGFLAAPSFEVVLGWRRDQERKLTARTGQGMSDDDLARFVAHYERLTRWMLAETPGRADLTFPLDEERRPSAPTFVRPA